MSRLEEQITQSRTGHILTHTSVWSPDSQWIVYDSRSDPAGTNFDGARVEMVNVSSGEVRVLFEAKHEAHCGVATFHPSQNRIIFILGPERPTSDWQYCAWHRQGVIVEITKPGLAHNLDACDLVAPYTAGALRGGSHVHVWDAAGQWVSFTYEDHVLAQLTDEVGPHEQNLRNVGVSVPGHKVRVSKNHPRNHDGDYFSVVVTRTTANPQPGSDEIQRACEEGWIGTNGYVRADGSRQQHALAFQGQVKSHRGDVVSEVFLVNLPNDLTLIGDGPLAGTEVHMPRPPRSTTQRRLTFTSERKFPGIQGPRHWLHSSPDGRRIAFLMKDDHGVVQLWTVSPNGGEPVQVTHNPWPITSAFSWNPDGRFLTCVIDNSVCLTEIETGKLTRLTPRREDSTAPRPEACVISPDGKKIAFVRQVESFNQIFVVNTQ
ncbi:MAG TPA: DUF3748 domain-containing protein [Candidatus Limnocylindrales bacterium]|nr:DUF3748 domain-containing protein [Candidatus Limnocylindrales bacterium]